MKSILGATGMDEGWPQGDGQGDRPGWNVKGAFNPARVRPDWAMKSDPRPIFPKDASGPYAEPFPILTGAVFEPTRFQKVPDYAIGGYLNRERNT